MEPLGVALGIALLIMYFIVALYTIPTGSMQPTLHGKNDYDFGDKVLVNKFIYRFNPPERWDVFVFTFPYRALTCTSCELDVNRHLPFSGPLDIPANARCPQCGGGLSVIKKDYIKRCVGLPGDVLMIKDGNLLKREKQGWTILSKTPEAQGALWQPVFRLDQQNPDNFFRVTPGRLKLTDNRRLQLSPGPPCRLAWKNPDDLRGHGDKGRQRALHDEDLHAPVVGDDLLEVELAAVPAAGHLTLGLEWNGRRFAAAFDWKDQRMWLAEGVQELVSAAIPADARRLSFAHLDGRLLLRAGERELASARPGLNPESDETLTAVPFLEYEGNGIEFADLRLLRDLYYVSERQRDSAEPVTYTVPPDCYFALGDNAYYSWDSRGWGTVRSDLLLGKALCIVLPPTRIKMIY